MSSRSDAVDIRHGRIVVGGGLGRNPPPGGPPDFGDFAAAVLKVN